MTKTKILSLCGSGMEQVIPANAKTRYVLEPLDFTMIGQMSKIGKRGSGGIKMETQQEWKERIKKEWKRNAMPDEKNKRLFLLIDYDKERHEHYISGYTFERYYPSFAAEHIIELRPRAHIFYPQDKGKGWW